MVRIGIMSFAHMHAYGYAASLGQTGEATLAAVYDDDVNRGQEAAQQFNAPFEADIDAFLASDLDAVIITSENIKHRSMAEKAAAAGKWILCEKPLATTVEDAAAIVEACRAADVGLGTAFPCRFASPLAVLRHQVAAGEFGAIYAASCTNNGQFPGGWFGDRDLAGGGATMDHTVHVADLLRWMLDREFTKVYCENGHLHGRDTELDDVGCLHLEMEGGIIVSHIASWNRAKSYPTWGDVTIEFIGEKGVAFVDAFNQKINVYNDSAMRGAWAGWGDNPDLGLVQEFVDSVRDRRAPSVTGVDGLKATEVTVAAYESMASGKTITL